MIQPTQSQMKGQNMTKTMEEDNKPVDLIEIRINFVTRRPTKKWVLQDKYKKEYPELEEQMYVQNNYSTESSVKYATNGQYKIEDIYTKKDLMHSFTRDHEFYVDRNGNYYIDIIDYCINNNIVPDEHLYQGNAKKFVKMYPKIFVFEFYVSMFPNHNHLHTVLNEMATAVSQVDLSFDMEDSYDIIKTVITDHISENMEGEHSQVYDLDEEDDRVTDPEDYEDPDSIVDENDKIRQKMFEQLDELYQKENENI